MQGLLLTSHGLVTPGQKAGQAAAADATGGGLAIASPVLGRWSGPAAGAAHRCAVPTSAD